MYLDMGTQGDTERCRKPLAGLSVLIIYRNDQELGTNAVILSFLFFFQKSVATADTLVK